jgi:hypothetical protein
LKTRITRKPPSRLCDCDKTRIRIKVEVKGCDPVGHAQLFKYYETCADCATCLSTGSMDKAIKKTLKDIIEKNKR